MEIYYLIRVYQTYNYTQTTLVLPEYFVLVFKNSCVRSTDPPKNMLNKH